MAAAAITTTRRGLAMLTIGLACSHVSPQAAARDRLSGPVAVVELRLSIDPALAETSRQVMLEEAEILWRRAGIDLRWLPSTADTAALPVSVVASDPGRDDHDEVWRLAKFQRHGGRPRAAVVSIAACEQALARVERMVGEPARLRERRLGLVLGRALAHELGHYLLNSGSHRRTGLMRASIQAAELAGFSNLGFDLDDESRAWLRAHVADVTETVAAAAAVAGTP